MKTFRTFMWRSGLGSRGVLSNVPDQTLVLSLAITTFPVLIFKIFTLTFSPKYFFFFFWRFSAVARTIHYSIPILWLCALGSVLLLVE